MDLGFYKQYEERFRTAINSDYARGLSSSEYKELVDHYKSDTGKVLRGTPGCSRCVMTALKEVGKFYFEKIKEGTVTPLTEGSGTPLTEGSGTPLTEESNVKKQIGYGKRGRNKKA